MNLYLLSQTSNCGYDTYDSCVVVAPDVWSAKTITPNAVHHADQEDFINSCWAEPQDILVTYIGKAEDSLDGGTVLCSSFNAG